MQTTQRSGFTLIELMIVVVIVGILAAVAVPTFTRFIYRSRASEATTFLQELRAREETYRADNGQYAAVGANPSAVPKAPTWGIFDTTATSWVQLGARPDAPATRFQYLVTAGSPGAAPADIPGFSGNDFWYMARATGDLDGDSTNVTFETYSPSTHIWCSEAKGWE